MPEPVTIIGVSAGFLAITAQLARRYFQTAKECFDVLMGFVIFILVLPILGLCAVIIRLSSKGPVLYTQVRVGHNGTLFRMYKLRTMYVDAESARGAVWASKDDPRVVAACRWMRVSHADELPQLLNVIKGDMSLVGPRPERPEILQELQKHYPNITERLLVRPGITGLAQIRNGYDTDVNAFRNKLESDLEYITRQNWKTELGIMVATISKVYDKRAR